MAMGFGQAMLLVISFLLKQNNHQKIYKIQPSLLHE